MQIDGLRVAPLEREAKDPTASLWHRIEWQRAELPKASDTTAWCVIGPPAVASALEAAGASARCADSAAAAPDALRFALFVGEGQGSWMSALSLTQDLLSREGAQLTLVTRGAVLLDPPGDDVDPHQAALWGFGRAAQLEHPELSMMLLDIDAATTPQAIAQTLLAQGEEDQLALRSGTPWVPRLLPGDPAERHAAPNAPVGPAGLDRVGARAWRVEPAALGQLDTLALVETTRAPPGPGQVEIEVEAAGLNFIDVLSALGALGDAVPSWSPARRRRGSAPSAQGELRESARV